MSCPYARRRPHPARNKLHSTFVVFIPSLSWVTGRFPYTVHGREYCFVPVWPRLSAFCFSLGTPIRICVCAHYIATVVRDDKHCKRKETWLGYKENRYKSSNGYAPFPPGRLVNDVPFRRSSTEIPALPHVISACWLSGTPLDRVVVLQFVHISTIHLAQSGSSRRRYPPTVHAQWT